MNELTLWTYLKLFRESSKDVLKIQVLCYIWNDPSGWSLPSQVLWLLPQSLYINQWIFSQFLKLYELTSASEPLHFFFRTRVFFLPASWIWFSSSFRSPQNYKLLREGFSDHLSTSNHTVTFYHYILFPRLSVWNYRIYAFGCYLSYMNIKSMKTENMSVLCSILSREQNIICHLESTQNIFFLDKGMI